MGIIEELGKFALGENASISVVPWSKGGYHAQTRLYLVNSDKKLIMKTYDPRTDGWNDTPMSMVVQDGSAIAVVGTFDKNTRVFYQPCQKVIAAYSESHELCISGIPTTLGSLHTEIAHLQQEVTRLEAEKKKILTKKESGMLGLIPRRVIDGMDQQTRARLTQRLGEEISRTMQNRPWCDLSDCKGSVESLSNEFGLGVRWRGGVQYDRLTDEDPGNNGLAVAFGYAVQNLCHDSTRDQFNMYLYLDTLYRLSRYCWEY
jgi:hypothetical protein